MPRTSSVSAVELASPCPHCGSGYLTPALADRALCVSCRRCWEVDGSVVRWVSPWRCSGCELRPLCSEPVHGDDVLAVLSTSVRRRHRVVPGSPAHPVFGLAPEVPAPLPPSA